MRRASFRTGLYGRPGGTRTPSSRIWSPELYQLELLACFPNSKNKQQNSKLRMKKISCINVGFFILNFVFILRLCLLVRRVFATEPAVLLKVQFIGCIPFVLDR
jgi:hypothetical protein